MKKVRLLLTLVLAVALCIPFAGCGGSNDSADSEAGSQVAVKREKKEIKIGDKYSESGIYFQFDGVSKVENPNGATPASGKEFYTVNLTAFNQSGADIKFSSILCCALKCDGASVDLNVAIQRVKGIETKMFDGAIANGDKLTGVIVYELPVDWKNIEFIFTPDFYANAYVSCLAEKSQATTFTAK